MTLADRNDATEKRGLQVDRRARRHSTACSGAMQMVITCYGLSPRDVDEGTGN